jgi:Flp pilus assembly pilin Flp
MILLRRFLGHGHGLDLIEYTLLMAFIALLSGAILVHGW